MKNIISFILLAIFSLSAYGNSVVFHECDVLRLEASKDHTIVFVDGCTRTGGAQEDIPSGNAYTNFETKPYLWLSQTAEDIEQNNHLLSILLAANISKRRVLFRWEMVDARATIKHLLLRE